MTSDVADQMTAILKRIGASVIEATPEWWTEATLRVEAKNSPEGAELSHLITSEEHHKDLVVGTEEIFSGTRQLQLLSEQAGEPSAAFVMKLRQEGGDWKFQIEFEYPARPGCPLLGTRTP
jgi:hypothetical protein